MMVSLILRVDEPRLEPIYSWLEQHRGSSIQLFGWDANQRAALLAYGDGSGDLFGWANWMTKITDDPSTLLPVFEQLELLLDEARRVSAQRDLRRRLQRRITRDSLGPVDERLFGASRCTRGLCARCGLEPSSGNTTSRAADRLDFCCGAMSGSRRVSGLAKGPFNKSIRRRKATLSSLGCLRQRTACGRQTASRQRPHQQDGAQGDEGGGADSTG